MNVEYKREYIWRKLGIIIIFYSFLVLSLVFYIYCIIDFLLRFYICYVIIIIFML